MEKRHRVNSVFNMYADVSVKHAGIFVRNKIKAVKKCPGLRRVGITGGLSQVRDVLLQGGSRRVRGG